MIAFKWIQMLCLGFILRVNVGLKIVIALFYLIWIYLFLIICELSFANLLLFASKVSNFEVLRCSVLDYDGRRVLLAWTLHHAITPISSFDFSGALSDFGSDIHRVILDNIICWISWQNRFPLHALRLRLVLCSLSIIGPRTPLSGISWGPFILLTWFHFSIKF
mgnify:CR=1 FL=1